MKKYLILPTLIFLIQFVSAKSMALAQQDSLTDYTGKYQTIQGAQTIYADVYIENGKLIAKSSAGEILTLDHISGDNFIISKQAATVKFIRNAANKVSQIAIMGSILWTRVDIKTQQTAVIKPAASADYLGKYQITLNSQTLYLEVSLKDGQLWCTQLWDGANSALDYISGDDFIIRALSIHMQFKRDQNKSITQLLLNGTDLFKKVKS